MSVCLVVVLIFAKLAMATSTNDAHDTSLFVLQHFCFDFSDLSTYTWSELPCKGTPPSPRYFHSCCIHGNKLYTYGGYSGSERLADMFAYGKTFLHG